MSTGLWCMNLRVCSVICLCASPLHDRNAQAGHGGILSPSAAAACFNGMSVSVQSVVLVNIIYFLYLCFVTLPIYSLVVHMGKVLREQALPTEMRERLQRAQVLHEQVLPLLFYIVFLIVLAYVGSHNK